MTEVGRLHQSYRPAGWYVDPEDDDQYLYWDGTVWTGQRHPIAIRQPEPPWFMVTMAAVTLVILLMIAALVIGATTAPRTLPPEPVTSSAEPEAAAASATVPVGR